MACSPPHSLRAMRWHAVQTPSHRHLGVCRPVSAPASPACSCSHHQASVLPLPCLHHRWYDPLKKETNLNAPAIKKWLSNGALPSDTVKSLLQKAYVMEPKKIEVVVPKDAVKL